MRWAVRFSKKAGKQYNKMPLEIRDAVQALVTELELKGPMQFEWKNFGKLKGMDQSYHCHVKSGRPTYVVCWQVIDKQIRIMEIYYVGTHEGAPY